MKLHEFEEGKVYQLEKNLKAILKVFYRIVNNEGVIQLQFNVLNQQSKKQTWNDVDIEWEHVVSEYTEYIPQPVKFEDWEEGRGYMMEGDTHYYYFLKGCLLMCQGVVSGIIAESYLRYNVLVTRKWYPTDKWF